MFEDEYQDYCGDYIDEREQFDEEHPADGGVNYE